MQQNTHLHKTRGSSRIARRRQTRRLGQIITRRPPTSRIVPRCCRRSGKQQLIRLQQTMYTVYDIFLTELAVGYIDGDGKPHEHFLQCILVTETEYEHWATFVLLKKNRHDLPPSA